MRVGNFAEEVLAADCAGAPGCVLDSGAARFEGASEARSAYRPHSAPKPPRQVRGLRCGGAWARRLPGTPSCRCS